MTLKSGKKVVRRIQAVLVEREHCLIHAPKGSSWSLLAALHWWKQAKKQQLKVFLCPPPACPAKPRLRGSNYFWQGINRSRQWNRTTELFTRCTSEPSYQMSKSKVTPVCLQEQLCKLVWRQNNQHQTGQESKEWKCTQYNARKPRLTQPHGL